MSSARHDIAVRKEKKKGAKRKGKKRKAGEKKRKEKKNKRIVFMHRRITVYCPLMCIMGIDQNRYFTQ